MTKEEFGCINTQIRTATGYFDLAKPTPEQIRLEDIVTSLSRLCRFGGHCKFFYSVAQHSVRCWHLALKDARSLDVQRAVLAHDFVEAYTGDLVRPYKNLLQDAYKYEAAIQKAIGEALSIPFEAWDSDVREIDNVMVINEKRQLFSSDGVIWPGEESCRTIDMPISEWCPGKAADRLWAALEAVGLT